MYKILKIKEKLLPKITEKFQFNGKGDITDPILINSLPATIQAIKFRNITSNISIRDINSYEIKIIKSKNINIENCKLLRLSIIASHNIEVNKNSIIYGNLRYCRDSLFKNNLLHRDYAAVTLSEKGSESGDQLMRKIQIGLPIALIFPILYLEFYLLFVNSILGLLSLFIFILPLIPIIVIEMGKKIIKDFNQNKFENNWYDTLEDLRPLFLKP